MEHSSSSSSRLENRIGALEIESREIIASDGALETAGSMAGPTTAPPVSFRFCR